MLFYTVGQSRIFLAMLYAGLAVGLWYDVLRLCRHLFVAGRALSALLDVLFGIGAAVIALMALLRANYGELRLYALMGVLCGYILYAGAVRPPLTGVLQWIARLVGRAFRRIARFRLVQRIFR